jgi:hypothetical protein
VFSSFVALALQVVAAALFSDDLGIYQALIVCCSLAITPSINTEREPS